MGHRRARFVDVAATGEARVPPDRVRLDLGLEVHAATPGAALSELAEQSDRLLAVLDAAEVAPADRQTTHVQLHPDHIPGRPRPSGFAAGYQLVVHLSRLAAAGPILDACARAVETSLVVGGLDWSVADPEPARELARAAALERAVHKARALAAGVGAELGPALRVSEEAGNGWHPVAGRARAHAPMAAAMAVEPGTETVSVMVSCRFALLEPAAGD